VVFPGAFLDRFADVRGKLRQELEAKAKALAEAERVAREREAERERLEKLRIAKLEELARQEYRVQESSRWIAMLPFGAGQFQNGQSAWGWAFLSTEGLLAGTSVVTYALVEYLKTQGSRADVDVVALQSRQDSIARLNRISFGAFAGVALLGVAHAQLTFVPERSTIRERAIPKVPAFAPSLDVHSTGGVLSISGVF
jgi:hypothetical protein